MFLKISDDEVLAFYDDEYYFKLRSHEFNDEIFKAIISDGRCILSTINIPLTIEIDEPIKFYNIMGSIKVINGQFSHFKLYQMDVDYDVDSIDYKTLFYKLEEIIQYSLQNTLTDLKE